MIHRPLLLAAALLFADPAHSSAQEPSPRCPASSASFLGTRLDFPFFVFDGGVRGEGLGEFDQPAAITALEEGTRTLIAVSDSGNHRIKVMTEEGFFQDFWGGAGSAPGRVSSPAGMAMSDDGEAWVADSGNHRIQKLRAHRIDIGDLTGQPLATLGRRGNGRGEFESPAAVAVDARGNLYVADTGNHRIQKLSPAGKFLAVWGGPGDTPGRFQAPSGILVTRNAVHVVDTGNHRIQTFDLSGRLLRVWGSRGNGPGQLESPRALAVDAAGFLYVADSGNHRIQKFDPAGQPVAQAGCPGKGPGEFDRPSGLVLDKEGFLYVVDSGNHRVQKLGPQ